MTAKNLPASWSSTGNSLEAQAFACKDALLVIDDFAPHGSQVNVSRLHKDAERFLRAQGNRSGRGRLRQDGSPRPVKPPQGTALGTGEDVPRGHSIRARLMIIEVEPGDVKFDRLTVCQGDAASGLYASAMAGYVAWLSPRFDAVAKQFKERSVALRGEIAGHASHKRVPDMVGELLAAVEFFFMFCVEAGALSTEESQRLRIRCQVSLIDSAERRSAPVRFRPGGTASCPHRIGDLVGPGSRCRRGWPRPRRTQ